MGSVSTKNTEMNKDQKGDFHISCVEYIKQNMEEWLTHDRNILDKPPTVNRPDTPSGLWKWKKCARKEVDATTLTEIDELNSKFSLEKPKTIIFDVFSQPTSSEPKKRFYYWSGNDIDIPFDVAVDFFTQRIDLTPNFTAICTQTKLLASYNIGNNIVSGSANENPNVFIWYQRYEPTEPFVKARNLVGIYCIHRISSSEVYVSMRSVPPECVPDYIDLDPDEPLIVWNACVKLQRSGDATKVYKCDSENEGGLLFEWMTNLAFPQYVQEEAIKTTKYIKEHREKIIEDYDNRHRK